MHANRLLPTALAALSLFSATAALAQDNSLERVTVLGSRKSLPAASSTDTLVPVDIYSMGKVAEGGGQFDLAQSLQYLSPSFNSTRQTGADGADLIDSAALRGLGSEQTLVLVNGKRISGVNEVSDLPTEAILRLDILPEEVALGRAGIVRAETAASLQFRNDEIDELLAVARWLEREQRAGRITLVEASGCAASACSWA